MHFFPFFVPLKQVMRLFGSEFLPKSDTKTVVAKKIFMLPNTACLSGCWRWHKWSNRPENVFAAFEICCDDG